MDRVHIPHDDNLAPGTWTLVDGQPAHRCPQCKVASVMTNHSVDADGMVNASMACFAPCTFHIWGILDGWKHGVKAAGEPIADPGRIVPKHGSGP